MNPNNGLFQTHHATFEKMTPESISLAQTIASYLSMNHLPVPEPIIFSGDPLRLEWMIFIHNSYWQKTAPLENVLS